MNHWEHRLKYILLIFFKIDSKTGSRESLDNIQPRYVDDVNMLKHIKKSDKNGSIVTGKLEKSNSINTGISSDNKSMSLESIPLESNLFNSRVTSTIEGSSYYKDGNAYRPQRIARRADSIVDINIVPDLFSDSSSKSDIIAAKKTGSSINADEQSGSTIKTDETIKSTPVLSINSDLPPAKLPKNVKNGPKKTLRRKK